VNDDGSGHTVSGVVADVSAPPAEQTSAPLAMAQRAIRERLLDIADMPLLLRVTLMTGVALMVGSGAMIMLRSIIGEHGIFGLTTIWMVDGHPVALANIIIIMVFAILLYGWASALTGALHSHWGIALLALLIFTGVNALYLAQLPWGSFSLQTDIIAASPLLPLILIWAWGGFIQWELRRSRMRRAATPPGLMRWTFVLMLALQLLFQGPTLAADVLIYHAPLLLAGTLDNQGIFIGALAIILFFLSASDLMEEAHSLAGSVLRIAQRVRPTGQAGFALPALTAIAAAISCAVVVKAAYDQSVSPLSLGLDIVGWIILAALLALALVGLSKLGRLSSDTPPTVPLPMLLMVTLFALGCIGLLSLASDPTVVGATVSGYFTANTMAALSLGVVPMLIAVLIGAPTLLAGRTRGAGVRLAGVFACAMGAYALLSTAPYLIALAGGPQPNTALIPLPNHHFITWEVLRLSNSGVAMVVALVSLAAVIALAARRRLASTGGQRLLAALFSLNVGLLMLDALYAYYSRGDASSTLFSVQAALVVGAFVWDLLMSGKITNHTSRTAPRGERVLIYLGYSLLTTVSVTLSLSAQNASSILNDSITASSYVQMGLLLMGIPLLLVFALRTFATWRQPAPDAPASSGALAE